VRFGGVKKEIDQTLNGILKFNDPYNARAILPQPKTAQSGKLSDGIGDLFLILHVELNVFVWVIGDNVLVGMVIHLHEVAQLYRRAEYERVCQ
jgi:hypothetical protein